MTTQELQSLAQLGASADAANWALFCELANAQLDDKPFRREFVWEVIDGIIGRILTRQSERKNERLHTRPETNPYESFYWAGRKIFGVSSHWAAPAEPTISGLPPIYNSTLFWKTNFCTASEYYPRGMDSLKAHLYQLLHIFIDDDYFFLTLPKTF